MNNNRTRAQSYQSFLLEEAKRDFSVLLFYYMKREHLEYFLETGNVKVTQLSKSNDPLEFLLNINYDGTSTPRKAFTEHNEPLVVCLSSRISSPTMWGHYAESHKGVCLVFSIPIKRPDKFNKSRTPIYKLNRAKQTSDVEDVIIPVRYTNQRKSDYTISDIAQLEDIIYDTIATKSLDWAYEHEVRLKINENRS